MLTHIHTNSFTQPQNAFTCNKKCVNESVSGSSMFLFIVLT